VSAGIELDGGVSLQASLNGLAAKVGGLCDRLDRQAALARRASQAFRQVPFVINVPLVAGAATLNPAPTDGPGVGYFWSVRKLAAVGFTAGSVNVYIDNTGGEPVVPFPAAAVNTFGKGEQLINPNSNIAVSATGITGTVQIWGRADCFESWLLPWYMGAYSDLA
jgi:hypothetical protein